MAANTTKRIFRFGVFEADEETGELRKQGRRLALQGQPVDVLLLLLDRPGELVTRTEIQKQLWSEGTFVDFDHSLNTAINKIREALGDSATRPRFVETLARRGYRFIAPVEVLPWKGEPSVPAEPTPRTDAPTTSSPQSWKPLAAQTPSAAESNPYRLTSPEEMPQVSRPLVRAFFLLLQAMYFGFYIALLARLGVVEAILRSTLTHTLWAMALMAISAAIGIPIRLYLISASAFNAPGLRENFLRIFPVLFPLDESWALAPFLLAGQIGYGLAFGATAILLYVPFAERSLILMGAGAPARTKANPS